MTETKSPARSKRCRFLGQKVGTGRTCSSPLRGGVVDHRTDCQACAHYAAGAPAARDFDAPRLPPRRVDTTTVATARVPLPCVHEGSATIPPPGQPAVGKSYINCDAGLGVVCRCNCNPKCKKYDPDIVVTTAPRRRVRVDSNKLNNGARNARFNASMIRYRGKLLMAYRTGWAGAEVHVARMSEDYVPLSNTTLALRHPHASHGREDPRLFVFRGRLHVAYIGVVGPTGPTNVLYARLTDDLKVEQIFAPQYSKRRSWEKNWEFFEWAGELFAVYDIRQHQVLHVQGDKAYPFSQMAGFKPRWTGGEMRGGASPVLVGDEFVHWFHGRVGDWVRGVYTVGCYKFRAKPPFDVVSYTDEPLLRGEFNIVPYRAANYPAVVFPCGAVLDDGVWKVSMGVEDQFIDIAEWDDAQLTAALVTV